MIRSIAAFAAAALLACAPALAQDVRTLPAAKPLTGAEKLPAVQGAGCATKTTPCATVAVTPAAVSTFLAPTFQARDADLDAIAALSTQSFGRSLLTQADGVAARGTLGLGTLATQAADGVAITGGSITGVSTLATTGTVKATTAAFSGAAFSGLTGFQLLAGIDTGEGFLQAYNFASPGNTSLKLIASSLKLQVPLGNYANDSAAASGGVPVNGLYRNGSVLMIRVN